MPRGKRRQTGGGGRKSNKGNQKKKGRSNKDGNKNNVKVRSVPMDLYTPDRINREVREIRMMMANNNDESAMRRISLVQQNMEKLGRTPPLTLKCLQCVILAQCYEYEAIKLVLHEIEQLLDTEYINQWDVDNLKFVSDSCKQSGQIRYLMVFLDRALNQKQSAIPKTEDRCRQLYFAYFVNGCYSKQSSLGTQMKRTFKHNAPEYTMWIVTATLTKIIINNFQYETYTKSVMGNSEKDVDSLSTELSETEDKVLKIQQMMFERQFLGNAKDGEDIRNFDALINIYYRILKLRKEWTKLNDFIAGKLMKEKFVDKNKLKLWALECFVHLNDWKSVGELCSSLLFDGNDDAEIDNPFIDDWEIWFKWIDAQLVLYQEATNNNELSDEFMDETMQRIQQIQQSKTIRNINKFRAPFLSEIELHLKCTQFENGTLNEATLSALISKYVQHFAARNSSCFDDVRKYLNRIEDEDAQRKLLQLIRRELDSQNEADDSNANMTQSRLCKVLQREICYHQIELYFGLWMNEEEEALVKRVQSLHREWHLNADKIEKQEDTDETVADGFILLAVHILLHLAASHGGEKSRDYMMDAIFLCEMGVEKSEYNFRIRLYLLRLYCHPNIGNIYGALRQFEKLKISGVQFDSLSHVLYHDAARYGFTTKSTQSVVPFLHSALENHRREFSQANLRRTEECFEHNNYHKAIEFAEFSYTMTKSEMYLISQADQLVPKLVNYHLQQKQFPKMSDYLEAFVVPAHPHLKTKYFDPFQSKTGTDSNSKEETKEKDNKEGATKYEWNESTWIDLNDYTTIPIYVREQKQRDYHKQFVRPVVSSLSDQVSVPDGIDEKESGDHRSEPHKVSHIQLIVSHFGMLYTSLTFNGDTHKDFMTAELGHLWKLLHSLKFVDVESSSSISKSLELCDDNNYHWILVHCLHSLNMSLSAQTVDVDALTNDLAVVTAQYRKYAECLRSRFAQEISKENKFRVKGVHLERLWRFISVLSFTAVPLFEHWCTEKKLKEQIRKLVIEKYQTISKQIDQVRRTLSEVVKGIEANTSIIAISKENKAKNAESNTIRLEPKDLEKVLKQHSVDSLKRHNSCLDIQGQALGKRKIQTMKIAMIKMNNEMRRNYVDVLTQNMMMLKQLRFAL